MIGPNPPSKEVLGDCVSIHCPNILRLLICETCQAEQEFELQESFHSILQSCVTIFSSVTQALEPFDRSVFVNAIITLFITGNTEEINVPEKEAAIFKPLALNSPVSQKLLLLIFTAVVGSAHIEVGIPSY